MPESKDPASDAFAGLTVLDLSQVLLGPYATMLMNRMGADVIKIEPPTGDPLRTYRTSKGNQTASVSFFNAGKRSLRLDLKKDAGRGIFLELAERADVVVENFGPRTMEKLGIDYAALKVRNSRIILASGRGYGQNGPYKDYLAMDLVVQAITGVLSTTGYPDNPPVKAGVPLADMTAGIHLFAGIAVALYHRAMTGEGQHVTVSMHDSLLPSLSSPLASWIDNDGEWPERTGNRHSGLAVSPYNVYPASDGWVAILALNDRHWKALCRAMGQPDLINKTGFTTNQERAERIDDVDRIVSAWTKNRTRATIFQELAPLGIPASPVKNLGEVLQDPQVEAEEMFIPTNGPDGEEAISFNSPIRLSASDLKPVTPAPAVGAQSQEILAEKLGLTSKEISDLVDQAVI